LEKWREIVEGLKMSVEDENFISRWSKRKQQVSEEQAIASEADDGVTIEIPIDPEVHQQQKLAELNALTDDDMPDVEMLTEDSDYASFMSSNVSEGLRKMALAKLFHGKAYNFRDGLDEYDDDYTFFEKLDSSTITSDMKHMVEVEVKRAREKERQQLLAEADGIDGVEDFEELDEIAGELDEVDLADTSDAMDESFDPFMNEEGFDTTEDGDMKDDLEKNMGTNTNEDVA
jgi:hypothetical protein